MNGRTRAEFKKRGEGEVGRETEREGRGLASQRNRLTLSLQYLSTLG